MKEYSGLGTYARAKSPDVVIKELLYLKKKFRGIKTVLFYDELFILNKQRVKELSKKYREKISLPFECSVRADLCDEETIKSLKEMGCGRVNIAIESGDEELRHKVLNKKITNRQIINAFALCNKHGIQTMSLNMIGLPNETPEQIEKTIRLNQAVRPYSVQVSVFTPFNGTSIYDYCKEQGLLKNNDLTTSYYSGDYLKNPKLDAKKLDNIRMFFGYNYHKKYNLAKAVLMLCRDFTIPYYLKINPYLPARAKRLIYMVFWNFKALKFLSK
jgi:radical SAM superfamily enzyme YgiQ (UPF0313 family)